PSSKARSALRAGSSRSCSRKSEGIEVSEGIELGEELPVEPAPECKAIDERAVSAAGGERDLEGRTPRDAREIGARNHRVVARGNQAGRHFEPAEHVARQRVAVEIRLQASEVGIAIDEVGRRRGQRAEAAEISELIQARERRGLREQRLAPLPQKVS